MPVAIFVVAGVVVSLTVIMMTVVFGVVVSVVVVVMIVVVMFSRWAASLTSWGGNSQHCYRQYRCTSKSDDCSH